MTLRPRRQRRRRRRPHNAYDAALAAAVHLCQAPAPPAGGWDLADRGQLARALSAYNRSAAHVAAVLAAVDRYDSLAAASEMAGG